MLIRPRVYGRGILFHFHALLVTLDRGHNRASSPQSALTLPSAVVSTSPGGLSSDGTIQVLPTQALMGTFNPFTGQATLPAASGSRSRRQSRSSGTPGGQQTLGGVLVLPGFVATGGVGCGSGSTQLSALRLASRGVGRSKPQQAHLAALGHAGGSGAKSLSGLTSATLQVPTIGSVRSSGVAYRFRHGRSAETIGSAAFVFSSVSAADRGFTRRLRTAISGASPS